MLCWPKGRQRHQASRFNVIHENDAEDEDFSEPLEEMKEDEPTSSRPPEPSNLWWGPLTLFSWQVWSLLPAVGKDTYGTSTNEELVGETCSKPPPPSLGVLTISEHKWIGDNIKVSQAKVPLVEDERGDGDRSSLEDEQSVPSLTRSDHGIKWRHPSASASGHMEQVAMHKWMSDIDDMGQVSHTSNPGLHPLDFMGAPCGPSASPSLANSEATTCLSIDPGATSIGAAASEWKQQRVQRPSFRVEQEPRDKTLPGQSVAQIATSGPSLRTTMTPMVQPRRGYLL
eukprot:TRINITY_DN51056_c0_g1_i1.p1 TRINITY_DN51056_c0_g1~~TRINITY_DN51056_c0_g1_i1.p1  ORF type:complete len:285 (-),score=39.81 TRINITY_DN51056_c0_g1_i1:84-938(-)